MIYLFGVLLALLSLDIIFWVTMRKLPVSLLLISKGGRVMYKSLTLDPQCQALFPLFKRRFFENMQIPHPSSSWPEPQEGVSHLFLLDGLRHLAWRIQPCKVLPLGWVSLEDHSGQWEEAEEQRRLYEAARRDMEQAVGVQSYMLPSWFVRHSGVSMTSYYEPSGTVGGDLFDLIPLPENRYLLVMGDITGKGVQAALLMGAVKSVILNGAMNFRGDLVADFFLPLREQLSGSLLKEHFLTGIFCLVDPQEQRLSWINAGHPPCYVYSQKNHRWTPLDSEKRTLPLGWRIGGEEEAVEVEEHPFFPGDLLLAYTDGLFECFNPEGRPLSLGGLEELLHLNPPRSPVAYPFRLAHQVDKAGFSLKEDDVTLAALELNPPEVDPLLFAFWGQSYQLTSFLGEVNLALTGKISQDSTKAEILDFIQGQLRYALEQKRTQREYPFLCRLVPEEGGGWRVFLLGHKALWDRATVEETEEFPPLRIVSRKIQ